MSMLHLFLTSIIILSIVSHVPFCETAAQSYYYSPSQFNSPGNPNQYPYYVPPLQTYNVCPELFYFFDYEPFILSKGEESSSRHLFDYPPQLAKARSKSFDVNKTNDTETFRIKKKNSTQLLLQSQIQMQPTQTVSQADGPFFKIVADTYERCCPLNRNRLKPIKVKDDSGLYELLFESFSNQTHILHYQSQGIFSIMEFFNQQTDLGSFNPFYVQIMNSQAFYLISKREQNGAPTITPIALTILLNAWPMLVIILMANAYAAIFIWFLDRAFKKHQFPHKFVNGVGFGMWWSYFLFTATSLAPRIDVKSWVIRIFTVIWMMISLVIIVIFIAMFTSQLTMYALNGQSLNEKVIAINKYSTDRIWLDTENAVPVEYDSINDMFRDLDDLKIDYVLLDQIFANFYSKIINEKFYVMRQVSRKKSFNVLLRGFNSEQLTCFQTTSAIFAQQWQKLNLSSNSNKIKDTSKYFNITDELLYPQRNVILFVAIGLLAMIVIIGISWQITCMKQPGLSSLTGTGGGGSGGGAGGASRGISRFLRDVGRRARQGDGDVPGLNQVSSILNNGAGNVVREGGRQGLAGIGDSILNPNQIQGLVSNLPNLRSLNVQALPNNDYVDRSVKFNPLINNFYYTQPTEVYDKALISARDQAIASSRSYPSDLDSDKFIIGSKNWNYYKMNDKQALDEMANRESQSEHARPVYSNDFQLNKLTARCLSCNFNTASTQTPSSYSSYNLNQGSQTLPSTGHKFNLQKQIVYCNHNGSVILNAAPNTAATNVLNQESNTDDDESKRMGSLKAGVGSMYANSQVASHHKELPRNESFYLTEYSSVKL